MKIFITGITGFAGSFLAENLVVSGAHEISGTYFSEQSIENVTSIKDRLNLSRVDLQDFDSVKKIIEELKPDMIFHLAALAATGNSFETPSKFINNNIDSQVNLLEAVKLAGIAPKILIVSSAEVYGDVKPSDLPIDEMTPLRPANPYAVSKLTQDFMGLQYFIANKIPIIRIRPFNHIGPRQSPDFVVARFAAAIAEIEKGSQEPVLKVGNLAAKRDFTDVRDMVQAYIDIMERGEAGEVYNAGSGKSVKIEDILNTLLSFSDKDIKVEVDPKLKRPIDVEEMVCDYTKLNNATGWHPKIELNQTLHETLDYFRNLS